MPQSSDHPRNAPPAVTPLDQVLAAPMFMVTLFFVGLAGLGIHLIADPEQRYLLVALRCFEAMLILWAFYPLEYWLHWRSGAKNLRQNQRACLFPPLRLCGWDHVSGENVWLPYYGWRTSGRDLAEDIERDLGFPMIAIALAILPLLAFEHIYAEQIESHAWLGLALHLSGALIWLSFAAEFVVLLSLTTRRIAFVKNHWLDLAIICLPMIAFLRSLRLLRAARLHQLGRTARVFRLRGLAMRAWRAVLLFEVVERLIHRDPVKRLEVLHERLREKEREVCELQDEIRRVQQMVDVKPDQESISAVCSRDAEKALP